ncbi:HD domain-containing protein [candidate division CSSED10-310 bacterium]|uniref:HD domain-containing protein n=1 Tax=candidate division CSSED10-310 bacterium TaxID=2855610 RepID=A0ABV6YU16_UNCC1
MPAEETDTVTVEHQLAEKKGDRFVLHQSLRQSFPDSEITIVLEAYDFLLKQLGYEHPQHIRLVEILLEQKVDHITIAAALLVPTVWANASLVSTIKETFGSTIATLVEYIQKVEPVRTDSEKNRHDDMRTFLNSLTNDTRVIILRLGFRLVELENLVRYGNEENYFYLARETIDVFVPLADRLSMGALRKKLEDVCFRLLKPQQYQDLARMVSPIQAQDNTYLEILQDGVKLLLKQNNIKASISGRTKSLFSIYRKMSQLHKSLPEIMDRIGLRIVVASVPDCYKVLGIVHTHFRPIANTFDDYIGLPKENGYQSLHTCVYPVRQISHKPVEFQIRTRLMHLEAEFGIAAHWRYKSERQTSLERKEHLQWLRGLTQQHCDSTCHEEFITHLRQQVFNDQLVVFGAAGQFTRFPQGATVNDFVKRFSPPVAAGIIARVNGEIQPLQHPLQDGDTVELSSAQVPSEKIF